MTAFLSPLESSFGRRDRPLRFASSRHAICRVSRRRYDGGCAVSRLPFFMSAGFLLVVLSSPAHGDPIFVSETFGLGGGACCVPFDASVHIPFGIFTQPINSLLPKSPIFENYLFTSGDIGSTFSADAASDPDFASLVSILTNGTDDEIGFSVFKFLQVGFPGVGEGISESIFFRGLEPARFGPDLIGYQISRINLTIQSLSFSPYPDPAGSTGTSFFAQFSFSFDGTPPVVPEPGTVALVTIGLAGILGRLRRRRPAFP